MPDSSEGCPTVSDAAAPANPRTGCPASAPPPADSDGDGVPDSTDACPAVVAATLTGCPLPPPGGSGPTEGNDVLNGDALANTICGLLGDDTISGGGGNDTLFGDRCDDRLNGDGGNDKLYGAGGRDTPKGGKDANTIKAGAGNDSVKARNGKKDKIDCGAGRRDTAVVDKADKVKGCEKVKRARKWRGGESPASGRAGR